MCHYIDGIDGLDLDAECRMLGADLETHVTQPPELEICFFLILPYLVYLAAPCGK